MFGLKTPIAQSEKCDEFDSVTTILSQSSVAKPSREKRAPPWLTSTGENGSIFHLELPSDVEASLTKLNNVDGHSVNSLALGAGCNSEDTGYSSDQDLMAIDNQTNIDKAGSGSSKNKWKKTIRDRHSNKYEKSDSFNKTNTDSRSSKQSTEIDIDDIFMNHRDDTGQTSFKQKQHISNSFISLNGSSDDIDDGVCLTLNRFDSRTTSFSSDSSYSRKSESSSGHFPAKRTSPSSQANHLASFHESKSESLRHLPKLREYKTIHVELTADSLSSRKGLSLLEDLLGIVPGRGSLEDDVNGTNSHDVFVKAIVHGGPASLRQEITVGSWLTSINGQDISWSNMDFVLSTLGKLKKVKLTLKSLRSDKSNLDFESLVNVLASEAMDQPPPSHVAVSYISLKGVDLDNPDSDHDGILYSYPKENNSLIQLHGLFYTLAHLVKDMDKESEIRNSTIELEGQLVHIAYLQESEDILIFAMPASCASIPELNALLAEFSKFLRLLYGSVDSVFEMKENTAFIDNILTYLFHRATAAHSFSPSFPTPLPSSLSSSSHAKEKAAQMTESHSFVRYSQKVPCLSVSTEVKMTVDKIQCEFESSDFHDMSENYYGCRRHYTILGSAYFYSGYMVNSHLAPADLSDIHNYLQHLGILDLMRRCSVSQFVAWQEVYPTRFCHDIAEINNSFGYSEPNARWCVLIIGLKRGLFCCLLETIGIRVFSKATLSPDIFYVDQAKSCLLRIQSPQMVDALNISINEDTGSSFTKSDYCATYINATGGKTARLFSNDGMKMKKDHSSLVSSLGSEWTNSSLDRTDEPVDLYNIYKSNHVGKMYADDCQSSVYPFKVPGSLSMSSITLKQRFSSTRHPLLYHYCCLDGIEGTVILSNDMDSAGIFCSQIVHGFYRCCRQIHEFFSENDKTHHGIKEHGVLMTFDPHPTDGSGSFRDQQALEYWIVGRQLKRPRKKEVFACFHESVSQNMVELAFRHSFGSS